MFLVGLQRNKIFSRRACSSCGITTYRIMEAIAKCLLVVSICLISNEAKESGADARNKQVRRWYHGCHSMIPCPPPFCDNPVYGPGNCCGYCPPDPVTSSPEVKPEAETEIAEPDDLKRHVEKVAHGKAQLGKRASQLALFTRYFTTTSPKTTTYCPYPCTHQGTQFCFPLPCYINCVDAVKPRGACCYTCQNGELTFRLHLTLCILIRI